MAVRRDAHQERYAVADGVQRSQEMRLFELSDGLRRARRNWESARFAVREAPTACRGGRSVRRIRPIWIRKWRKARFRIGSSTRQGASCRRTIQTGPAKSHGRRAAEHLLGLNGRRKKARKVRPGEEGVSPELAEAAERVREELRAEGEAADALYQAGAAPGEAVQERQPPASGKKAEPHGEDLLGILKSLRQDFEAERRVFDKWDQEDEAKKKRRKKKPATKGKSRSGFPA